MEEALFRAAYPGTDPDSLTNAVFYGLLNRAVRVRAILDGRDEDVDRIEGIEKSRSEIYAQHWFPTFFPPEEDE